MVTRNCPVRLAKTRPPATARVPAAAARHVGAAMYRFSRYYAGSAPCRRKGGPADLLPAASVDPVVSGYHHLGD